MHESIVRVEGLSHRYGKTWAIRDIHFKIDQKGILGLLGSNGAGKSTTMNILCGVLNQTEGTVVINGLDSREQPETVKQFIGFLPQNAPLYPDFTVDEYLTYCAHLRSIDKHKIAQAVAAVKERCGIAHFSKRLIGNLSGGYKQRVGIAQAIIHRPMLVVLDEPTNGLDPNQILEVRNLIKEIATERSVIFSSHILSEVQATCKDIIMIEDGTIVFSDSMEAFNNYIEPNSMLVRLEAPPSATELAAIPGITMVEFVSEKDIRLHFDTTPVTLEKVVQMSVEKRWRLTQINLEKSSLDDIFARLSLHRPGNTNQ